VRLKVFILAAALLNLTAAHADQGSDADNARSARKLCKEAPEGTQQKLSQCTEAENYDLDSSMNALYKQKLDSLHEPWQTRLRDAQTAWIAFRDKSCLYEAGTPDEGGSSWGHDSSTCLAAHTRQRIRELKAYIACTENGCPF